MAFTVDQINPDEVGNLHGLFLERTKRSCNSTAYKYFDHDSQAWNELSWNSALEIIRHWAKALSQHNLNTGDRVGIMIPNGPEWMFFEQAANRLGLVTVPLYPNDRADNVVHIVNESNIKLLYFWDEHQLPVIEQALTEITDTPILICSHDVKNEKVIAKSLWFSNLETLPEPAVVEPQRHELATIVYTSGTTGKPKGVMLSHDNIIKNAYYGVQSVTVYREDLFLSFLPLSHTLERTVGYYLPIVCGSCVAYSRSIPDLAEDLLTIKPTVIISVPRIFERVYAKILTQLEKKSVIAQKLFHAATKIGFERFLWLQGRGSKSSRQLFWPLLNKLVAAKILEKLGGNLRFAISGGAPLPKEVGETFIGLGLQILQGYGLTETSPVISVNTLKSNIPQSIGKPLPGIEVRIGENGELQSKSDCVMLGYWQREQATKETFTEDGWIKTGDLARIDGQGHIYITGRLKEILVLSNGEKIPPVDMEIAISIDPLFEQAMVIGEGKPYLSAIVVLNPEVWPDVARSLGEDPNSPATLENAHVKKLVKDKIDSCLAEFPGYAQIHRITLSTEVWNDQNNLLTASLKMNRKVICKRFEKEIEEMYAGH